MVNIERNQDEIVVNARKTEKNRELSEDFKRRYLAEAELILDLVWNINDHNCRYKEEIDFASTFSREAVITLLNTLAPEYGFIPLECKKSERKYINGYKEITVFNTRPSGKFCVIAESEPDRIDMKMAQNVSRALTTFGELKHRARKSFLI